MATTLSYTLLTATPQSWLNHVLDNFDRFLLDHAACEKKASSMAMSLVHHYPDKEKLVTAMIELAIEELAHFREVTRYIHERKLILQPDEKDPYVNQLRKHIRNSQDDFLLDHLLIASIIERRGHERFELVAKALPEGKMKKVYTKLAKAEERHYELFLALAHEYINAVLVDHRLNELLEIEAQIMINVPIRAAVH